MSIAGPPEKCNKCGRESYGIVRKNTKNVGCVECSPERYYRMLESRSGCFSLLIVFVISIVLFNM